MYLPTENSPPNGQCNREGQNAESPRENALRIVLFGNEIIDPLTHGRIEIIRPSAGIRKGFCLYRTHGDKSENDSRENHAQNSAGSCRVERRDHGEGHPASLPARSDDGNGPSGLVTKNPFGE